MPLPSSERDVGLDLGLSALATTSDGDLITNPRHLPAPERGASRAGGIPVVHGGETAGRMSKKSGDP
jgi:hypothetical protein